MEEFLYQSLLLFVVTVTLLQLVKLAIKPRKRPPPGPWKLPVIGSMHHLINVLPHHALRDLAAVHGPLMMLQLGKTPLVVASSKETAHAVLKTYDTNFATRPKLLIGQIVGYGWVDIVFAPYGGYWRKLRQLCASEILSPKRVLSFRHIREEEVMLRVEEIRAMGPSTPVNLTVMFHSITNSVACRVTIGKKRKNEAELVAATKAVLGLGSGFDIPDLFPGWTTVLAKITGMSRRLKDGHNTIDTIFEEIIQERKAIRDEKIRRGNVDIEDNIVDVLLGLQEKGGLGFQLNNSIIKALILDMLSGGTGTSGSTLEWGMSELMRNPEVMKKLQGHIREAFRGKTVVTEGDLQASNLVYVKLVIKEIMRLHPPVPLLVPRESIEECELDGYTIPAKSRVVINAWAMGRDPRYWEDADEFKPERFEDGSRDFMGSSYDYLPFGSGRRICPGSNFALANIELALIGLLYHFDWSLPDGVKELDMEEVPGLDVGRRTPLLLCATPFVPVDDA